MARSAVRTVGTALAALAQVAQFEENRSDFRLRIAVGTAFSGSPGVVCVWQVGVVQTYLFA